MWDGGIHPTNITRTISEFGRTRSPNLTFDRRAKHMSIYSSPLQDLLVTRTRSSEGPRLFKVLQRCGSRGGREGVYFARALCEVIRHVVDFTAGRKTETPETCGCVCAPRVHARAFVCARTRGRKL